MLTTRNGRGAFVTILLFAVAIGLCSALWVAEVAGRQQQACQNTPCPEPAPEQCPVGEPYPDPEFQEVAWPSGGCCCGWFICFWYDDLGLCDNNDGFYCVNEEWCWE
jgi:hypothetical protein